MSSGSVPRQTSVDKETVGRRSAMVRALLADRIATRVHREAEERGERIAKTAATLRDIRTRNHLGEMVSGALKAGEDAKH